MRRQFNRGQMTLALHPPQKRSLLGEDELVLLRKVEVRKAFCVRLQPRAIRLILRQTGKRDQSECNIVGPLMRHPVTEQIASTFRNDGKPALRIRFKKMPLERIEPVTNEDGDGHKPLLSEAG